MSEQLMERDLRALDEALTEDAVTQSDPTLRELQELALALRADAPEADPAFRSRLRERVRQGFPGRGFKLPALRRPPMPVLAGAASVLLAVAVAVPLLSDDGDDGTSQPLTRNLATEQESRAGADALTAPVPPQGGDFAPGRDRRIERSAALTLVAPGDELDEVAAKINTVTDRHNGYVQRSSFTSGEDSSSGGSFDLRIPASRLQPALNDLAALGEVRSRSQSGQDITREYVTATDRLEAARAERKSLLRRLERATTDAQAEAIRSRLDIVAGEIRSLRGQVRELRIRTNYATVSVTLEQQDGDKDEPAPTGSTRDALDDAVGSLVGALNLALRVLGVAVPIGLLALVAWLAARAARRRRRESVLA